MLDDFAREKALELGTFITRTDAIRMLAHAGLAALTALKRPKH